MGLKDRIAAGAARAGERAASGAARAGERAREAAPVQRVVGGFQGMKALLTEEDEREFAIERALLAMVRAARSDDDEDLSDRDVERAAKSRWKRARRAALVTGPLAGMTNQLADLYCETATACDLDRLHDLKLSDEIIAATMLVLWNVTPDHLEARAAIAGTGPSVSTMLTARFTEQAAATMPSTRTKRAAIKALWDARGLAKDATERVVGKRDIKGLMFAGKRVKEFIARAEIALGVSR